MNQKTIGIVGGGQLGRMLTDAAHRLGFKVVVLDPTPNSPASQVADGQIIGSFKDKNKILELAKVSDFLTFELEGVNDEALEQIKKSGIPVNPDPKTLSIIKDKFKQKTFLRNHNIPVGDFSLEKIFEYPYLLKARFDSYDGRGNYVVRNKKDIAKAFKKLEGRELYAEKFVPFIKELAVVSARDKFNKIESFEVVETIHKNNICHIVRSPANVSPSIKLKAKKLAKKVLGALKGVGVFAIEMFLLKNGKILVNEIAPRVHNSGHHTIEAYEASQFTQHILAISGQHLEKPKANSKAAVMINILGTRNGKAELKGKKELGKITGMSMHMYGKMETRKERKMGHITILGKTVKEAETKAKKAHKLISI